jgi:hypothetical protein
MYGTYRLLLSDFSETWICPTDFQKLFKYQISRKSVAAVQLFRT